MKSMSLLGLASACLFAIQQIGHGGPILVDDFTTTINNTVDSGQLSLTVNTFEPKLSDSGISTSGGMDILGGVRETSLTLENSSIPGGTGSLTFAGGFEMFEEGTKIDTQFEFIYDGDATAGNDQSLGMIDITAGGNTGFMLEEVYAAQGSVIDFEIIAYSSDTDFSVWKFSIDPSAGDIDGENVFIGFNTLSYSNGFGVDLTKVTSIVFKGDVNNLYGSDFALNKLSITTPEPASIALMGLGGLLAGFGVRRRNKKKALEELVN